MAEEVKFVLRMPKALHEAAKVAAKEAFVSLNSYILLATRRSVDEDNYVPPSREEVEQYQKAMVAAITSNPQITQFVAENNALLRKHTPSKANLPTPGDK